MYAIEATVHAPTWEGVYGEIFKVLKPGGVVSRVLKFLFASNVLQFGVYEWCMTDIWDPSIPEHKALAHEIELGNGIPEMRSLKLARQALKDVGFNVEYEEDLAERKDHVEWYYPLEGDYSKAQTFYDLFTVWRTTWFGMFVMHNIMWFLELFGILPKGTLEVGAALKVAQSSLIKGGQTKVGFQV